MSIRSVTAAVALAALLVGFARESSAQTLDLAVLIRTQGTVLVGDKLFSDFAYGNVGDMPSAGNITVTGVTIAGNYGLRFDGDFRDNAGVGASVAQIRYLVTVLDPTMRITDAHLHGDPDAALGGGLMFVDEGFVPDAPNGMIIVDDGVTLID